jgi:membrane dipeptidase
MYADFLGDNPTLDTVCSHILHFLQLDPSGKHIALGGDLDGCDVLPDGFDGVQSYPALANRLLSCGVDSATVSNIFWNNAIEVIRKCCT